MKRISIFLTAIGVLACLTVGAWALQDITIYDKVGTGTGWYGAQEDNEVESPAVKSQAWDFEAWLLGETAIHMVAGWDFIGGEAGGPKNDPYDPKPDRWTSGDVFVDVTGDAIWGSDIPAFKTGNSLSPVRNFFGYDYVYDIDWENATANGMVPYTLYQLNMDSMLLTSFYESRQNGSPFRYLDGGKAVDSGDIGVKGPTATGFLGYDGNDEHYVASLDLAYLIANDLTAGSLWHFTQECGNDTGVGQVPQVPDGGTMLALLGLAVMGVEGLRRRI